MSATPKVNLVINQLATFRYKFVWKDKSGRPIDLTGYSARMQVRADAASQVVLLELTTDNSGVVLAGKTGVVSLYVSVQGTANLGWQKGVYDVKLTAPSGEVFNLVAGTVSVSPSITK